MGTVPYRTRKNALPLLIVLAGISITIERVNVMSTELLSSKVDLEIQNEDGNHDDGHDARRSKTWNRK
jgi:hypothetical protein